jgi:hypothetical protein
MEIYILGSSGQCLVRDGIYCHPLKREVIIQNSYLIDDQGESWPKEIKSLPNSILESRLVFIENDFDPIARIKRGKLYSFDNEISQPVNIYPYQAFSGIFQIQATSAQLSVQAYKFNSYHLTKYFNPRKTFFIFGNSRFETRWRILTIDSSVTNEEVYLLQEVNSIGAIPSLDKNNIPTLSYQELEKEYNSLLAELNSSPESVIDHCRDMATSLLTAISGKTDKQERIDLGKLISSIDEKYKLIKSSAEIINRLHPRRKPNEIERLGLNNLTRAEADFAIQCIFQIIREMKWDLP